MYFKHLTEQLTASTVKYNNVAIVLATLSKSLRKEAIYLYIRSSSSSSFPTLIKAKLCRQIFPIKL